MRREYLIGVLIAVLVAGGVFAVYQFYLKERLERYADDQLRLDQLIEKYEELSGKFEDTKPEEVIKVVRSAVEPWREAVEDRSEFFNMGDFRTFDPVPDNEVSYKLYYLNRAPGVQNEFNEYLRDEGKAATFLSPQQLWFRAPPPENVTDLSPNKVAVTIWFGAMQFGHSFVKMFVDADAISLTQARLWKSRVDRQVLNAYTAGVEFEMTMESLVAFLDKLRFDRDRYYDVNAIRIKNPYLKGPYAKDPWLRVEMVMTMAEYNKGAKVKVTKSATEGGGGVSGGLFGGRGRGDDDEEEDAPKMSIMDRILRLFPF